MIERVVVILGPFRSGTSLVAAVVHRLGFPVAPTIIPPAPPAWRADWEDPALTMPLMGGLVPTVEWLKVYLERRDVASKALGFEGRVALKSCYLALHWPVLIAALGHQPLVIRTYREAGARRRSLEAHPALYLRVADDARIGRAVDRIAPDALIGCEWAQENPLSCAELLAGHLGQADDVAVAAAAALIDRGTEYQDALPNGNRGGRA